MLRIASHQVNNLGIAPLGIGQLISWGTLYYSYPLIAKAMSHDLMLSGTQVYGAATIGLLAAACFAYPIGRGIDRGSGRNIMIAGSLLAGLLMLIWSYVDIVWVFYSIVFSLGVAQSMSLYEAAFAVVATFNGRNHVSQSITKLTLWGGFASTIFVPLTEFVLQKVGWRNTLQCLGMFNFAVAGLYYVTLPKASEKFRITKRSQQSEAFVLKSQTFWGLLLCFTLYSLVFSGLTFHLYPLFVENKLSPSIVAIGIGLLGPMQVIGRLLVWKFSKRAGIAQSARYVFFAFPVSVLAMIFLGPIWGLLMFIVTYGVANGIMTIVRGTAVPELLANDSYGSINSWISTPSTISKALGPFVFAYSFQHFSSYDPALMIALFATFIIVASYWYVTLKNQTVARNACCQQPLYSQNNA